MARRKKTRNHSSVMLFVGFLVGIATSVAASQTAGSHNLIAAMLLYVFAALGALHAVELAQLITLPLLGEAERKVLRISDGLDRTAASLRRISDALRGIPRRTSVRFRTPSSKANSAIRVSR